jgi:hypothetical protein
MRRWRHTARRRNGIVERLPDESVTEAKAGELSRALVYELRFHRRRQPLQDPVWREIAGHLKQGDVELASDHGSHLEKISLVRVQVSQAPMDRTAELRREPDRDGVEIVALERALALEHTQELTDEERIALGEPVEVRDQSARCGGPVTPCARRPTSARSRPRSRTRSLARRSPPSGRAAFDLVRRYVPTTNQQAASSCVRKARAEWTRDPPNGDRRERSRAPRAR